MPGNAWAGAGRNCTPRTFRKPLANPTAAGGVADVCLAGILHDLKSWLVCMKTINGKPYWYLREMARVVASRIWSGNGIWAPGLTLRSCPTPTNRPFYRRRPGLWGPGWRRRSWANASLSPPTTSGQSQTSWPPTGPSPTPSQLPPAQRSPRRLVLARRAEHAGLHLSVRKLPRPPPRQPLASTFRSLTHGGQGNPALIRLLGAGAQAP
ncbi:hypothetical protein ACVWZ8_003525 [Arthrobacter sp. UYCu723]